MVFLLRGRKAGPIFLVTSWAVLAGVIPEKEEKEKNGGGCRDRELSIIFKEDLLQWVEFISHPFVLEDSLGWGRSLLTQLLSHCVTRTRGGGA